MKVPPQIVPPVDFEPAPGRSPWQTFVDFFRGFFRRRKLDPAVRANLDAYRDLCFASFADLQFNHDKVSILKQRRNAFGLGLEDVHRVHVSVLVKLSHRVLEKEGISGEHLDNLALIASTLEVGWPELPENQARAYYLGRAVIDIQRGKLPEIPGPRINVQGDEIVHEEVSCQVLEEHVYWEHVGGSRGISVRIARGVYYHTSGSRGRSVSHSEVVAADQGVLAITSKRLAFLGTTQNFSFAWSKLLRADMLADGVALAFTGRKKTIFLRFLDLDRASIVASLVDHYTSR